MGRAGTKTFQIEPDLNVCLREAAETLSVSEGEVIRRALSLYCRLTPRARQALAAVRDAFDASESQIANLSIITLVARLHALEQLQQEIDGGGPVPLDFMDLALLRQDGSGQMAFEAIRAREIRNLRLALANEA